jgi:hypothetical protein
MHQHNNDPAPGVGVSGSYAQTIAAAATVDDFRRSQDQEAANKRQFENAENERRKAWLLAQDTVFLTQELGRQKAIAYKAARDAASSMLEGQEAKIRTLLLTDTILGKVLNLISTGNYA